MKNTFEDYINDGNFILITPVDILLNSIKYMNLKHPFIEYIFQKFKYNDKEPKYNIICTYILYNEQSKKFYIGSGNLNRKLDHYHRLKNNKHYNWKFQNAYNENSNFSFYYVQLNTRKEALAYEQILIDLYWGDPDLLNLSKYVETPTIGKVISDESRLKMRLAKLNKPSSLPNGHHSDKTKNIISVKNKLIFNTTKNKEKYSLSVKKLWNNPIYRNKVIRSIHKTWSNPNLKKRHSLIMTGNKNAPEQRIIFDDVEYPSIVSVSKKFNIPTSTIHKRLNSNNFPNWIRVIS